VLDVRARRGVERLEAIYEDHLAALQLAFQPPMRQNARACDDSTTCPSEGRPGATPMKYDRTITAYHGCDARVAERILSGEPFQKSENAYDWLGSGVYFWEFGADRALKFADVQKTRGKVETPAVVGAILQLGNCFDLMDTVFTDELRRAFEVFRLSRRASKEPLPKNRGRTPDKELRLLDCAVLNFYLQNLEDNGLAYDTVRYTFIEGPPAFPGSKIRRESHIQLAVRNPACIVGVFRPMLGSKP
jgi:hypothetical protein